MESLKTGDILICMQNKNYFLNCCKRLFNTANEIVRVALIIKNPSTEKDEGLYILDYNLENSENKIVVIPILRKLSEFIDERIEESKSYNNNEQIFFRSFRGRLDTKLIKEGLENVNSSKILTQNMLYNVFRKTELGKSLDIHSILIGYLYRLCNIIAITNSNLLRLSPLDFSLADECLDFSLPNYLEFFLIRIR